MSLDSIIKDFNKNAKRDIVTTGIPEYHYRMIPFTSPRMNYCTFGGIPVGKLVMFYGSEHGGKTTSALDIVANYQQCGDGRKVIYVDAENSLDTKWATKLGVTFDESLLIVKPEMQSAEEILQFLLEAVQSGEVGLWVLDSIPALSTQQELDKTLEEKTMAGVSGVLSVFCRQIEKYCASQNCTGIFINQVRDDMNAMWAGAVRVPGGKAVKFFCSVIMKFSAGKFIDAKGNELTMTTESPAGRYIIMSMEKNKCCPPTRRTGFYTLNFNYGIDYLKDLVEVAIKYGIIVKSGAWFSIVNEDGEQVAKLQGQAKVNEYLDDENNSSVLEMIESLVDSKIQQ